MSIQERRIERVEIVALGIDSAEGRTERRVEEHIPGNHGRREGVENLAEFMRQFVRAGGKMVAGTDTSGSSGGIAGVRLHRELQLWVARGIPPIDAIRAATQYPSELFRLPDVGTVEAGKKADMVILKGNPLDDIRFLGAIDRIVLNGDLTRLIREEADFGHGAW